MENLVTPATNVAKEQTPFGSDDRAKAGAGAPSGNHGRRKEPISDSEGEFILVPVSSLRTTYSICRSPQIPVKFDDLRPLPLRVVPTQDNAFEIIDGFKRFETWTAEGRKKIPVLVESPGSAADHKRRLLLANSPRRTLSPLDEGLVVRSLLENDGLTAAAAAKLLGHKKEWISQRLAFTTRLSSRVRQQLATKAIGPTLAHYLTSLPQDDQDKLLDCFSHHRLPDRHRIVIVQAYRVSDLIDRRRILAAPLGILPSDSSPALSPRLHALEKRLENVSAALADLESFQIPPDLPPAEQRRLEALSRGMLVRLKQSLSAFGTMLEEQSSTVPFDSEPLVRPSSSVVCRSSLELNNDVPTQRKEKKHDSEETPTNTREKPGFSRSGEDSGTESSHQCAKNFRSTGTIEKGGDNGAGGEWATSRQQSDQQGQACPVSGNLGGAGFQGLDRIENSAGADGFGLSGPPNDSGGGSEPSPGANALAEAQRDKAAV